MSIASVVKWSQRYRATGSAAAGPMGSRRPVVLEAERAWLAEQPELTVRTLAAELAERGKPVSLNTMWELLRRAGHSFKKALFVTEQDRPSVASPWN